MLSIQRDQDLSSCRYLVKSQRSSLLKRFFILIKPSPLKIITKALSIDTDYAPQSSCTSPNLVLVNIVQIVPTTPTEYSFPSNDSNVGLMVIGKNECEIKPEVFKPLEVYNNTEFTKFIQASKELEIFDRSSVLYSENVASKRRKVDKEKIERVPYCAADCAAVIPDIDPTPRTFDEPVIAPECETYPDFYNEEIAAMDKAFKMYGRNFSKVTEAVHVCGVMLKMRGVDVVVKNCKDVIWFHYKNKFRYGWHHVEVSRRSSRKRC